MNKIYVQKGYFCPCSSCEPRICPSDAVCPQGSNVFIPCSRPFYYVASKDDSKCSETAQFYLVVFGSVFAIIILITVAFFTLKKKRRYAKSIESKRLLSDNPEIVYHGY